MTNHIKIYGVKPRIQYVSNGNLKKYEFPFAIFKTSDVDVYLDDKLLTTSEYEVSVDPDIEGGTISFKIAPSNGTVITIARNLSIERTTDFQEGGALRADVLNTELDYQIACQQQIADSLNRSMVLPPYAVDTDVDLTLPTPSAGKAIVWNKDGTNLENSTIKVNELESTLNGYKTEAQNAATTAINKADIAVTQAIEATSAANQLNGMRTNCITEIPQDIKLELNNGVLTLKAGSKLYLKTDTTTPSVNISSDLTTTQTTDGSYFAIYNGSTLTTVLTAAYNYSTLPDIYSYPLGIVIVSGGTISTIEQIFNGFGYIGSTIFVLPGVKGLIPNGRKEDGTLKNIALSCTSIKTVHCTSNGKRVLAINNSGLYDVAETTWFYNPKTNRFENVNGTVSAHLIGINFNTNTGIVSNFNIKDTFLAIDYNNLSVEMLNSKGIRTVVKTHVNGTEWYRIWSDGWIEQGGQVVTSISEEVVVNLLKPFSNTNYTLQGTRITGTTINGDTITLHPLSSTTFGANSTYIEQRRVDLVSWSACGY